MKSVFATKDKAYCYLLTLFSWQKLYTCTLLLSLQVNQKAEIHPMISSTPTQENQNKFPQNCLQLIILTNMNLEKELDDIYLIKLSSIQIKQD